MLRRLALVPLLAARLSAQGVTGAAIQGRVTDPAGAAIPAAHVRIIHDGTGERWTAATGATGGFFLEHLTVGGPYRIEVRAIGRKPITRPGLVLSLGQRVRLDLVLDPAPVELEPLVVRTAPDSSRAGSPRGPAQLIPESTFARLPIADRNLFNVALLSPLVSRSPRGGLTIAGQPSSLNALQIDGVTANDLLFGISTAGADLGARNVPIEAIQALEVVTAPFDVRFGDFAAGLLNAVTKSGTNQFRASAFGYYSARSLIGQDLEGERGPDFRNREIGLTLEGPIVKDRLAFFLEAGIQRHTFPQNVPVIGTDTTNGKDSVGVGIRYQSVLRFQDIMRRVYGVAEPGSAAPYPLLAPAENFFLKLTAHPGSNGRLELSHEYSRSEPDVLTLEGVFSCRFAGFYCLSSSGFRLPQPINTTRISWTTAFGGRFANQATVSRLRSSLRCDVVGPFASIAVDADDGRLVAGAAGLCTPEPQHQQIIELNDDLSLNLGNHVLTVGTHDELLSFATSQGLEVGYGHNWEFRSLDALERGEPSRYTAVLPHPAAGSTGRQFGVVQVGGYLQDRWSPTTRLTVTGGLRFEVPFARRQPTFNPTLLSALEIDNTRTPSGHPLWSPRLGATYDLTGDGRTVIRGGAGVFAGRPAYKWFNQVYHHTGLDAIFVDCVDQEVPTFTVDLGFQPNACRNQTGDPVEGPVNVFDPAFRFPRNLKLALGLDRRLPAGWALTVDLLYTRGLEQFYLIDRNLAPLPNRATGEGNRPLYGTIDPEGRPFPSWTSPLFASVLQVRNASGDRALSLSVQLEKRFSSGATIQASYAHTGGRDRFSSGAPDLLQDLDVAVLDGDLASRRLARSDWAVPHRITALLTAELPFRSHLAFFYEGQSGFPITYVVGGDANADGYVNDPIYVPRDASPGGDIELARRDDAGVLTPASAAEYDSLESFIAGVKCLDRQRGQLTRRNSCRNSWINGTSLRLSTTLPSIRGRSLEIGVDVFNPMHLVSACWGVVREIDNTAILELVGYDQAQQRGIYTFHLPNRKAVNLDASRWRLQLGVRTGW